jgi:hypothetical protein
MCPGCLKKKTVSVIQVNSEYKGVCQLDGHQTSRPIQATLEWLTTAEDAKYANVISSLGGQRTGWVVGSENYASIWEWWRSVWQSVVRTVPWFQVPIQFDDVQPAVQRQQRSRDNQTRCPTDLAGRSAPSIRLSVVVINGVSLARGFRFEPDRIHGADRTLITRLPWKLVSKRG